MREETYSQIRAKALDFEERAMAMEARFLSKMLEKMPSRNGWG